MSKENNVDELFQAPAQISKIETMSDGGVRVVIDTQEINDSEELTKLFRLRKGDLGYFLFKGSEIKNDDLPDDKELLEEGDSKTPSQRLRAVIFVHWKEVKGGKGDFNAYYREQMEKFITAVKEKLPPKSVE